MLGAAVPSVPDPSDPCGLRTPLLLLLPPFLLLLLFACISNFYCQGEGIV